MNTTLKEIRSVRSDLSDYLFHFTKGPNALNNLWEIIRQQRIIDIHSRGRICFTEAPLTAFTTMFDIFDRYPSPQLAPYGVAISKAKFLEMGGRPAIYGPARERSLLDKSIRWRYVELSQEKDFSWLREWRIPVKEIPINPDENFIIARHEGDIVMITHDEGDIEVGAEREDGGWATTYHMQMKRVWKTVTLENIKEQNITNPGGLISFIDSQKPGDEFAVYLGSTGPG